MQTQACIRHLAHVCLMHQANIDRGFEDVGRQFYRVDILPAYIFNLQFNRHESTSTASLLSG